MVEEMYILFTSMYRRHPKNILKTSSNMIQMTEVCNHVLILTAKGSDDYTQHQKRGHVALCNEEHSSHKYMNDRNCIRRTSLAYFLRAVRIFMEIPHCTQVFIGLGQPFPLTVIPSISSRYTFTSETEFALEQNQT